MKSKNVPESGITTKMLVAAGCKFRFTASGVGLLAPPQEALSPNGYLVASRLVSIAGELWNLTNRSKGRWRKVKFRIKAISRQ